MRCFASGIGAVVISILTLLFTTGCNRGQVDAIKAESASITQAVNDAKSVKDTVLDETRAQKQQIISMIQAGNATLQATVDRITHVEAVLRKDAADPNATPEQRAIADQLAGELIGLRQVRDKVNGELIAMGAKLEEISDATDDRPRTKNPREPLGFTGISGMGREGFEPSKA